MFYKMKQIITYVKWLLVAIRYYIVPCTKIVVLTLNIVPLIEVLQPIIWLCIGFSKVNLTVQILSSKLHFKIVSFVYDKHILKPPPPKPNDILFPSTSIV